MTEVEKNSIYEQLRQIDTTLLDKTEDFGKIVDFGEIVEIFERLRDFTLRFVDGDMPNRKLSSNAKTAVENKVKELLQQKDQILELTNETINSIGPSILQTLRTLEDQAKNQLNPQMFVVAGDIKRLTDEAKDAEENAKKIKSEAKRVEELAAKLKRFEEQAGTAASKQAAGELNAEFNQVADNNSKYSWWWLGAAILFAISILWLIFGWWPLKFGIEKTDFIIFGKDFSIPESAIVRLLLISLFGAAMQFSLGNFRTTKHLNEVNRFRANVLNVIERLSSAEGMEKEVKIELLKGASSAIFNLNDSGYLRKKEGKSTVSINPTAKWG